MIERQIAHLLSNDSSSTSTLLAKMECVSEKKKYYTLQCKMPFGKYAGLSIEDIISRDPNYVAWAIDNIGAFVLDEKAYIVYKRKRFW